MSDRMKATITSLIRECVRLIIEKTSLQDREIDALLKIARKANFNMKRLHDAMSDHGVSDEFSAAFIKSLSKGSAVIAKELLTYDASPDDASGTVEALKLVTTKNVSRDVKPAPDDAPLGKYAFADERDDVPQETDTAQESDLFRTILSAVVAYYKLTAPEVAEVREILKSGYYRDFFAEPSKTLYRGMQNVSREDLLKLLNVRELPSDASSLRVNSSYVPKSASSSSWTISKSRANAFASESDVGSYSVVLEAQPSGTNADKFFELTDRAYDALSKYGENFSLELEVIGLGVINLSKVTWSAGSSETFDDESSLLHGEYDFED